MCDGDTQVFEIFLKGMNVKEVIEKFSHIQCKERKTSCIGELCKILLHYY